MAKLHMEGTLVVYSEQKAFEYFSEAAKLNHGLSMLEMGTMYEDGLGCEKNGEKALNCYLRAADFQIPEAVEYLSMVVEGGLDNCLEPDHHTFLVLSQHLRDIRKEIEDESDSDDDL